MRVFKSNSFLRGFFLMALALALSGPLHAQTGPEPTKEETIATAIEDLQSGNADRRKGAVMLLAKYPNEIVARRGLLRALDDEAAIVRRAAVVSLIENRNTLSPAIARKLVLGLEDPDAEVRQSVASALDLLLLQLLRGMPGAQNALQPVQEAIRSALGDEQPIVRRRVLESIRFFPGQKPTEEVRATLDDPVVAVRLAAYETAASILPPREFIEAAAARHPDPSVSCRLLLANSLARRPHPASAPLLEKLRADEDPRVASAAAFALFLVRPQASFPEPVLERIAGGRLESIEEQRLLQTLRALPTETGRALARTLLEKASGDLRRQAANLLLRSYGDAIPEQLLLRLMEDESGSLRQSALRFARSRGDRLSWDFYDKLAENPHANVRANALAIAGSASPEIRRKLAFALLIDEEPSIRGAALETIAVLRPDNLDRIFMASLRDPDPTVRRRAVNLLLGPLGSDGRRIARDFLEQFPDAPVADILRRQLSSS